MANFDATVTVDILNEQHFLDCMQRALDLAATAQRACDSFNAGERPSFDLLQESIDHFQLWFETELQIEE